MKTTMTIYIQTQKLSLVSVASIGALLFGMSGCGSPAKEQEPVVTVQTSPTKQAPISQLISAEAVVFPVQQAVITPKITAPIRQFFVQRGSRVHQGQLLAKLEDKDLAAAAEQSKGEFTQAEAGYATTVGAGLPSRCRKPNWTPLRQRRPLTRSRRYMTAARSYFSKARFRGAISIPRKSHWRKRAASINKRRNSSTT